MSIIIQNITEGDPAIHHYQLRINQEAICTFEHARSEGLAQCLRQAAEAVEIHSKAQIARMVRDTEKYLKFL